MKNIKTKILMGSLLAFSLALCANVALSKPKSVPSVSAVEVVSEVESYQENELQYSFEEVTISEIESPILESKATKAVAKTNASKPSAREIFDVFKNALIDALKDLYAHIKKWLKIN